MDVNWCTYCEKQLDLPDESEISEPDEEAVQQMEAARKQGSGLQQKKSAAKPLTKLKRNGSGKFTKSKALGMTSVHSRQPSSPTSPATSSRCSSKNQDSEHTVFKPWQGLYCSAECMAKDEQRSRLAIANLDFSPPDASTSMPPKFESSHSSSSHSLRSYPSEASGLGSSSPSFGPRRHLAPTSPIDLVHRDPNAPLLSPPSLSNSQFPKSRRPQRPATLSTSSSRHAPLSHARAPSDASSSISLPSPTIPNSPLRMSRSSGLRSFVHTDASLDERPELHLSKSEGPRSRSGSREARPTPLRASTAVDHPAAQEAPAPRLSPSVDDIKEHLPAQNESQEQSVSKSTKPKGKRAHARGLSVASSKSGPSVSIAPSAGSLAAPVLSQGEEGNAVGTIIGSPKNENLTSAMEARRNSGGRPPSMSHFLRLRTYSSTSMQQLSRSPSSFEQDSCLDQSPKSSASTPPSEALAATDYLTCKSSSAQTSRPHIQVNNPHTQGDALAQTTLQDYALFRPRSMRSPGTPGHNTSPSWLDSSRPQYSGPLFNPSTSPSRSSRSPSRAAAIFESINSSQGTHQQHRPRLLESKSTGTDQRVDTLTNTRARLSGIKSSASVASLPHHEDYNFEPQSQDYTGPSTLRASSAPKNAWQWDPNTPQYPVLSTNKQGAPRKRLFYFDTPDAQ